MALRPNGASARALEAKAEEVHVEGVLAKWFAGNRQLRAAVFPGTGLPVLMRVLSRGEVVECQKAAYKVVVVDGGMPTTDMIGAQAYEEECLVQILARALRDPDLDRAATAPRAPTPRRRCKPLPRSMPTISVPRRSFRRAGA